MSFENLQQNIANSTGLILDRTVNPPVVLGQAFIVSKSRAVTCASCVFNYMDATWALAIDFPHPGLLLGVKAVSLHPDFDKKEARARYLAQTGVGDHTSGSQLNDLATLVIDSELQDIVPDKLGELQRALTLPFSSTGVEASGVVKAGEFLNLIGTIQQTARDGALILYDQFNIPLAHLSIVNGSVRKVRYGSIINEMAFSELVYRNPARSFSFQQQANISFDNIHEMSIPSLSLLSESKRRADELPNILTKIQGPQARYQRAVQQFDPLTTDKNVQWLAERLWVALDGYITIDKLCQRIGADTYSIAQGIRELANRGVISLLNRASPFACTGTLGTPLVSHTDFDINPGDPLKAFFLDPLSGAPNWRQGDFSGVSSVLQPKNLLHNIPIPPHTPGALILKDYRLVGVHNGRIKQKPGQQEMDSKLSQMIWIGALLDMRTKRLRSNEGTETGDSEQGIAGLRTRSEEIPVAEAASKLEKYICPSCYSTNTRLGACFNCGTEIVQIEQEPEPQGFTLAAVAYKIKKFRQEHNVTDRQLKIGLALLVGLPIFAVTVLLKEPTPEESTSAPVETQAPLVHHSSEAAVQLAVESAGFKGLAPPGYWYEDTSELTKPAKSFGLYSETSNQKILFVVFDDMTAVTGLPSFFASPVFTDVKKVPQGSQDSQTKIDEGSQIIGSGDMRWRVARYEIVDPAQITSDGSNPHQSILVGSFCAKEPNKSILVIGQPLKSQSIYDYKITLWLIDLMAEDFTKEGNSTRLKQPKGAGEITTSATSPSTTASQKEQGQEKIAVATFATDEEIDTFINKFAEKLQAKLVLPKEAAEELKKTKSKKLKATVTIGIDNEGTVKKIELTEPSEWDKINNALVKDINACAPIGEAPKTKQGLLSLVVTLKKDKISVDRP